MFKSESGYKILSRALRIITIKNPSPQLAQGPSTTFSCTLDHPLYTFEV